MDRKVAIFNARGFQGDPRGSKVEPGDDPLYYSKRNFRNRPQLIIYTFFYDLHIQKNGYLWL